MQPDKNKLEVTKSPFILMPILLVMWGSFAAVSKLLLNHLDSYQVLFYMYGLGTVVLFVILISTVPPRQLFSWKISEIFLLLLCGVLSFAYEFLYLQSLKLIPAIEASMLNYLFPIFIVLFAIPVNGENLSFCKIVSLGMGLTGTLLLVTKGDLINLNFTNFKGDVLAVLAAASWGLFTNLVKKNNKDIIMSTFFITFVAFILAVLAMFSYSLFLIPEIMDLSGVLWLSMSSIVFGFFLYLRALKYSSVSLVASFTFFTPFVTLLFIVLLLDERLTLTDGIAALLIFFSVSVQKLDKSKTS